MKDFFNKMFDKKHRSKTTSYLMIIGIYLIVEILMKTGNLSSLFKSLLVPACCYIVVALSLNLIVGFSGELSLGQASFMSIGGFTAVCVSGCLAESVPNEIIRLIICIVVSAVVSGIFGLLISIPVLKLEGDYLAIVTLAFCQIIKSLLNNIYLGFDQNGFQFSFIENKLNLDMTGKTLLCGPAGASGTDRISNFTVAIILVLITLFVIYNLISSKNGRAITAARDNRIAALSSGINVSRVKTLVFVIAALLSGAAGAIYGLNYTTLAPKSFDFNMSITILVYVVLGGLGNINGTIISTIILLVLPEMLRFLNDYRMLIYAILLIVIMLVRNNDKISKKIESIFKKKVVKDE